MMAALHHTVIDLVSSDDEDVPPPPRARLRGFFRKEPTTPPPEPGFAADAFAAPGPAPVFTPPPPHQLWPDEYDIAGNAIGGAEIIDLEDDLDFDAFFDMPGGYPQEPAAAAREPTPPQGQVIQIDGEEVFIPDSPRPVRKDSAQTQTQRQELLDRRAAQAMEQEAAYALETANFTADVCLKRVLAMFPDIDHEHVLKLYNDWDARGSGQIPGADRFQDILEKLLTGGSYPRQAKPPPQRKRKRQEDTTDQEAKRWEGADRELVPNAIKGHMACILKAEFPEMPNKDIAHQLLASQHLYPAYLALAKTRDESDVNKKWSGRPPKDGKSADNLAKNCGWASMFDELEAARKAVKDGRRQRVIEDAKKWAEKENLQKAIESGETAECQACFDDLPMNRQIHCDGETAHFTCFDCATAYVKSEVGDSRCRVLCTAGCGASFARAQLHLLEDTDLLEKLEQLQQEKDIRDAGLDNLEECPFCDYKAILPPIEEDFEFRCANDQCEKVSCRRCKAVSHIPLSCEEHAKDHKLSSRHKIEEAMTAALIRNCGKCKKGFIKEYGCNKMSCPSCGNLQCYVCSESLKDYNHFDQQPRGHAGSKSGSSKCPLYDNVEERHEREIKVAEAAARKEVINDNPDVDEEDLEIKVSDAVKKATDERVKRAGAVPGGIPPGYGAGVFAGALGGAGLLIPPMMRRAFDAQANDPPEAAEDDENGNPELVRIQRLRRLMEDQLQALRAHRNARPPMVARPRAEYIPGVRLDRPANAGIVGAFGLPPDPRPAPPAAVAIPDGFNEDHFGGGGDGDPWDLHQLMEVPPLPLAAAPVPPQFVPAPAPPQLAQDPDAMDLDNDNRPRLARQYNDLILENQRLQEQARERQLARARQARLIQAQREQARQLANRRQQIQQAQARHVQQLAETDAERLERLEHEQLQARQRFDNRRGGQGIVLRREFDDPQRHHGLRGWPGQN